MSSYRTKAIILKRRNQGESDRVLTLFSFEYGKFSAISKGSRKQKSKYGGSTELFTEADFVLSTGKTFQIVTEVSVLKHFLPKKTDLQLISDAHFIAELTIKSLVDEHPLPNIYKTLTFCLSNLGNINRSLLRVYYISQILKTLGSYPELGVCLVCQDKPKSDIKFSHTAGGIFCTTCKPVTESLVSVEKDTVKLWRFIQEATEDELSRLKINDEKIETLVPIVESFLASSTGREYNSLKNIKLTP